MQRSSNIPIMLITHFTAGATISIAIGWWCGSGAGSGHPRGTMRTFHANGIWWSGTLRESIGCSTAEWGNLEGLLEIPDMAYPYWCRKDPSVAQFNRWYELAAGWPFRCLWKAQAEYEPLEGAIPLPDPDGLSSIWPGQSMRGLPIRPIWPGLIGDSLIWAAITLSATLTTRTALRRRRLRRGLCPHCSYNRLHNYSTPCPECGALREP